jgi:ketosteroid isomerase-like protein
MTKPPTELVRAWVEALNRADADALADFYSDQEINDQMFVRRLSEAL